VTQTPPVNGSLGAVSFRKYWVPETSEHLVQFVAVLSIMHMGIGIGGIVCHLRLYTDQRDN